MTLAFVLLVAAIILFGIPAVRALVNGGFDFTSTGLACFAGSFLAGIA